MIPDKKQIEASKHILIKSDKESLAQASVLYSYCLSLHKKVSLYAPEIERRFSFLPWIDKRRSNRADSADLEIDSSIEIMDLYDFMQMSDVKINAKMATALYAGLLQRYENFLSDAMDGTIFAVLAQLITLGADHQKCVENIVYSEPLSKIRLKAILYKNLLLKENAKVAHVSFCDEDLHASGASLEDVCEAAREFLHIVHIREVHIVKSDENNKIIKIVKDV
ncbi:phosphoesterase [Sulfurimonas paralvinellae]|uniref:Phosphoesterase n=1 Tax=Sulfurimonas paralvinellae TaxID=317658 RepID=A0A7M1B6B0_9BACT|nr:phosphoesterase [Sulfurimonas paralvinellae]